MYLFSYLAFMCFLMGLAMAAALIAARPKAMLNWVASTPALGYSLYSFCGVWVSASQDPATIRWFFSVSVWGFGLLIPAGALAAELMLSRIRAFWGWAFWTPFAAYWCFSAVWGMTDRAIVADFHGSMWGNVGIHAHSLLLVIGGIVLGFQKLLIWTILWRALRKPELALARPLLEFFIPADAAALVLVIAVQFVTATLGLPSVAGLAGLFNVGLLSFVVWRYSRIVAAEEAARARGPLIDLSDSRAIAILDRYGITAGERGVLSLLLQGHDRKSIAARRFIAEGTVKTHIHSIYAKTGAKNRVELLLLLTSGK